MPLIPSPYYFVALQWLIRNGGPIVLRRLARTKPPAEDEPRFQGKASLERGAETMTGLLSITDTELVFEPSAPRTRGWALRIPLDEIEDVSPAPRRLLGVIPIGSNVIKVRSRRGIFRLVVDAADRDRWLSEISSVTNSEQ